jgi:hypothetical protein
VAQSARQKGFASAEPETATTDGTNITCRFNIEQWTAAETPGTNVIAGTFVLGALSPGDYTLVVNVNSNEVKTLPFNVSIWGTRGHNNEPWIAGWGHPACNGKMRASGTPGGDSAAAMNSHANHACQQRAGRALLWASLATPHGPPF